MVSLPVSLNTLMVSLPVSNTNPTKNYG
jgi:hypothetical protein